MRSEEDTVIHWFDEQEIDPMIVDVTVNNDEDNAPVIRLIQKNIGPPRNYGLTLEEKEEEAKEELAQREATEAIERAMMAKRELMERKRRQKNIEVWTEQLEEVMILVYYKLFTVPE